MQSSFIPVIRRFVFTLLVSASAWFCGTAAAQPVPAPAAAAKPAAPMRPSPADALAWDALIKDLAPLPGQLTADFIFHVRNTADYPVSIGRLQPSCGCTTAKLPTQPWTLAPGTNGDISVSVNLAGKFGALTKTVTVFSTNNQIMKVLTVRVNLPENPQMMRARNQSMARADQQAVFKGDCAACHVKPAEGKMGKQLYVAACGICHEAKQRAQMVPDLHKLNHPTFYGYWRMIIADGKAKTLMPAFSKEHGGPLSDEQIDSLAKVLVQAFPSMPGSTPTNMPPGGAMKTSALAPANGGVAAKN